MGGAINAGGVVKAGNGGLRSTGSCFGRLEVMEEMDWVETETPDHSGGADGGEECGTRVNIVVVGRKVKVESSGKSRGSMEEAVLRASHPQFVEGSKRVQASVNPNGQGGISARKGRLLKDIMNIVAGGPSGVKPTQGGPASAVKT